MGTFASTYLRLESTRSLKLVASKNKLLYTKTCGRTSILGSPYAKLGLSDSVYTKIAQALETLQGPELLMTNGGNESELTNRDLQIVDIQEDIDEMGDIIDVKMINTFLVQ